MENAKHYRYGWASQQAEKQYDIYTGITNDPHNRYMTGYAYYDRYGKSYRSHSVDEFFQEEMPPVPKDFPYGAGLWSQFHEQLQINALYMAAAELEVQEDWKVNIVNCNNAVGVNRKEEFMEWAVNCWINKSTDIDIFTDGNSFAQPYSKKVYKAVIKSLKSNQRANEKARQKYLKQKAAQLASELREVEGLLKA